MATKAVIGMKPGLPNDQLLDLARSVLAPGSAVHLVSLVQIGTGDDEIERLESTKALMERIASKLGDEGYTATTHVQVTAIGLGTELARIAESVDADLLVIGMAKRTRVGKALLGSDAQAALMHASCPVLAAHLD